MDDKTTSRENSRKILIAEDDEAILDVTRTILESEGYIVMTPNNIQEIFVIARHEKPQVILLDIWLRGHDGAQVAKELKSSEDTQKIPLIMMSANNQTERIAQEVKADGFLLKPFTIEELLGTVRKYTR